MWGVLSEILKGVLSALITGWTDHQKEVRTEATLTKLGHDEAEVARLRKEREVAKRAREIHAKSVPTDIRDITNRL